LSLERVIGALASLGLKEGDAQVYVYLAKKGPCKEEDLADNMKLTNRKLCPILERLIAKGLIRIIHDYSIQYSATPLDKVLDMLSKENEQGTQALRRNRDELVSRWRGIFETNSEE
jgi:sugar-specific transcriptional regulator TrmB